MDSMRKRHGNADVFAAQRPMNWASTEGGSEDVRPVTGVDVVVSSQGRDEHRKLQVALEPFAPFVLLQ